MFVPQAGKTAFNQSTLILITRVSFAVWCPRFETEETKNKHTISGKDNTNKFTPLLSVCLGLSHFVPLKKYTTYPHTPTYADQVWGENSVYIIYTCFTRFTYVETVSHVKWKTQFTFLHHVKNMLIIYALFSLHCQVCHVRFCSETLAMCRHCAGWSAAQSLCSPLCYYSCKCASRGIFVCSSPELEVLTLLSCGMA